ncbi:MAG: hypothetical protein QXP36_08990 [Conexivisphaerales archaeon]
MESINNGASLEAPRIDRFNDSNLQQVREKSIANYERVVSELVETLSVYEKISVEKSIGIVSTFLTITDPARKPGKHFVWAQLINTDKGPSLMFARKTKKSQRVGNLISPTPYLLPLEVWGDLVIAEKLKEESIKPSASLKGQLRYSRTGRKFFLALFFDEKNKNPVPWPTDLFVRNNTNFVKKVMEKKEASEMKYFIDQFVTDQKTKEVLRTFVMKSE